tara:strand:+ start:676 stop:876 length:201 start_codon:yes stop_codon:yes gene_type:complete
MEYKLFKVTYSDDPSRLAGGETLEKLTTTLMRPIGSNAGSIRKMNRFKGLKIHNISLINKGKIGKN